MVEKDIISNLSKEDKQELLLFTNSVKKDRESKIELEKQEHDKMLQFYKQTEHRLCEELIKLQENET